MNTRLLIALLVYVTSSYLMGTMVFGTQALAFQASIEQRILQAAVTLGLSCLTYYLLLPKSERKGFSVSFIIRFALAFVGYVVATYAAVLLVPALLANYGDGNLLVRLVLQVLIMNVLPYVAPPVVFLAVLWTTAKNKKNIPKHFFGSILTVASVAAACYAVYLAFVVANDRSGWSGLFAIPVFILSAALFLFDGLVMLRAGFKTPEDKPRLRVAYLTLGTIVTALVVGAIAWYIAVNFG